MKLVWEMNCVGGIYSELILNNLKSFHYFIKWILFYGEKSYFILFLNWNTKDTNISILLKRQLHRYIFSIHSVHFLVQAKLHRNECKVILYQCNYKHCKSYKHSHPQWIYAVCFIFSVMKNTQHVYLIVHHRMGLFNVLILNLLPFMNCIWKNEVKE